MGPSIPGPLGKGLFSNMHKRDTGGWCSSLLVGGHIVRSGVGRESRSTPVCNAGRAVD